jgi:hypothetical protein
LRNKDFFDKGHFHFIPRAEREAEFFSKRDDLPPLSSAKRLLVLHVRMTGFPLMRSQSA